MEGGGRRLESRAGPASLLACLLFGGSWLHAFLPHHIEARKRSFSPSFSLVGLLQAWRETVPTAVHVQTEASGWCEAGPSLVKMLPVMSDLN